MDSLFFLPNLEAVNKADESVGSIKKNLLAPSPKNKQVNEKEPEVEVETENVERPVDLYKVCKMLIFLCFFFFFFFWV